jgi:hypothetical protein
MHTIGLFIKLIILLVSLQSYADWPEYRGGPEDARHIILFPDYIRQIL